MKIRELSEQENINKSKLKAIRYLLSKGARYKVVTRKKHSPEHLLYCLFFKKRYVGLVLIETEGFEPLINYKED